MKSISNLEDFYHFIDDECNFGSFGNVLIVCARDVVSALEYLHSLKIEHRDLKPSNVLVSYSQCSNEDDQESI